MRKKILLIFLLTSDKNVVLLFFFFILTSLKIIPISSSIIYVSTVYVKYAKLDSMIYSW